MARGNPTKERCLIIDTANSSGTFTSVNSRNKPLDEIAFRFISLRLRLKMFESLGCSVEFLFSLLSVRFTTLRVCLCWWHNADSSANQYLLCTGINVKSATKWFYVNRNISILARVYRRIACKAKQKNQNNKMTILIRMKRRRLAKWWVLFSAFWHEMTGEMLDEHFIIAVKNHNTQTIHSWLFCLLVSIC